MKTLHPKLFGGILFDQVRSERDRRRRRPANGARADRPRRRQPLSVRGDAARRRTSAFAEAIEKIDVGGPVAPARRGEERCRTSRAVLRSRADYPAVARRAERRAAATLGDATRRRLAAKVFRAHGAPTTPRSRGWFATETGRRPFPERAVTPTSRSRAARCATARTRTRRRRSTSTPSPRPPPCSRHRFVAGQGAARTTTSSTRDAALYDVARRGTERAHDRASTAIPLGRRRRSDAMADAFEARLGLRSRRRPSAASSPGPGLLDAAAAAALTGALPRGRSSCTRWPTTRGRSSRGSRTSAF